MKRTALFAALAATFALAACNNDAQPAASAPASAASAVAASEPAPVPAASEPASASAASAPAASASASASAPAASGDNWCPRLQEKYSAYVATIKNAEQKADFENSRSAFVQNMKNITGAMMKETPEKRKAECDKYVAKMQKDIDEDIAEAKSAAEEAKEEIRKRNNFQAA